jgi:hypothetical protein
MLHRVTWIRRDGTQCTRILDALTADDALEQVLLDELDGIDVREIVPIDPD